MKLNPIPIGYTIPTETLSQLAFKVQSLIKSYPEKLYRGVWDNYSNRTVQLIPENQGQGREVIRILWEIGLESKTTEFATPWTIDLNANNIDLLTQVGGLVDSSTFENGKNYLVWGFLGQNLENQGIGVTRKPHTSFSVIDIGTAGKGAVGVNFTVVNTFQFTLNAHVVVRNTAGSFPEHEWNGAVISAIPDNNTLVLTMDNDLDYGVAITSVAGGEILQQNRYQPWVIGGAAQVLYQPYATLLGEIHTDGVTGNILQVLRPDQTYQALAPTTVYQASPIAGTNTISLGRWIPLNSEKVDVVASLSPLPGSAQMNLGGALGMRLRIDSLGITLYQSATIRLLPKARLEIINLGTTNLRTLDLVGLWHR